MGRARNSGSRSTFAPTRIVLGSARTVGKRLRATIGCQCGCGILCRCGTSRRCSAMPRGGSSVPKTGSGLRFVCSYMWNPYLQVIAQRTDRALHILDRFHITAHLNSAVDEVRRSEDRQLRDGQRPSRLKDLRWKLLRRGSRVRGCSGPIRVSSSIGFGPEGKFPPERSRA